MTKLNIDDGELETKLTYYRCPCCCFVRMNEEGVLCANCLAFTAPLQRQIDSDGQFDPQKILDVMSNLIESGSPGQVLTVKGLRDAINPIKIGELFGMEVWADPMIPPNVDWYITREKIR